MIMFAKFFNYRRKKNMKNNNPPKKLRFFKKTIAHRNNEQMYAARGEDIYRKGFCSDTSTESKINYPKKEKKSINNFTVWGKEEDITMLKNVMKKYDEYFNRGSIQFRFKKNKEQIRGKKWRSALRCEDPNAVRIKRAKEQLRQEREVFNLKKKQESRWFFLSLTMGYASVALLVMIVIISSIILFNPKDFTVFTVKATCAALFADVVGLLLGIWKIVLNPKFVTMLSPETQGYLK